MRRRTKRPQLALLGSASLGVLFALGSNGAWAQSVPVLYVTNQGNSTVSVIDTPSNTVTSAIPGFVEPWGAAARGDDSLLYVVNLNGGATPGFVSVIDTATNTIVGNITVGKGPTWGAISPNGTAVYVTNENSNTVSVINTATNTVTATIGVGINPFAVAVSPNGTTAYVANNSYTSPRNGSVSVINTATNTVTATIALGTNDPAALLVSPNGTTLYATSTINVSVIDTATNQVTGTIPIAHTSGGAVSPNGTTAYLLGNNSVYVVNTTTNTVTTTIPLGTNLTEAAVSPDGTTLYVTEINNHSVAVINTATNTVTATINLPSGAHPLFPGICSSGNALLAAGLTFKANTSRALACTLASGPTGAPGPIFTGGTLQIAGGNMTIDLPINVQGAGGTIDTLGSTVTLTNVLSGSGTLTVKGSMVFTSAAMWLLTVNGATASRINVSGTATLGGAGVGIATGSTIVAGTKYTILTASGGVSGTFNSSLTYGNYTGTLSYDADDVYLTLYQSPFTPLLPPGAPTNVINVAGGIDRFTAGGGALPAGFQNLYSLSPAQRVSVLSQLDGEAATDAEKGALQLTTQFLDLMLDPFLDGRGATGGAMGFAPSAGASFPPDVASAYAQALIAAPGMPLKAASKSFDQRWSAWGASFGGTNQTSGDPAVGSKDVAARDFGFAAGADYRASPDTVLGFALAGGGTNWGLAQGFGNGRSDAFQAGIYGTTHWGPGYLAGAAAFADHWFATNRTALGDQLTANFNGQSFGGRLEAGYRYGTLGMAAVGLTPYAALQAQSFHTPSYTETDLTGGGFGLTYNAMNATDTRSELGARFDRATMLGMTPLILRGRIAWAHDWVSNPALGAVFQALPGGSFTVNGAAPPKDSALTTASAELRLSPAWSLTGKFDGEFAQGSQTYTGTGTLRYSW